MNTRLPQRKRFLRSLISIPTKVIDFLFQSIFILLLSGFFLLLLSGIYLGVYVNHHLDDPMSYTPYPVHPQPPDGLTLRQFIVGIDAYYDNHLGNIQPKTPEVVDKFWYEPVNHIVCDHAFLINQIVLFPLASGSVLTDALATINPKGWIAQTISPKDYRQHVEPIAGKYDGIVDLPEVLVLQIQANYWYVFGDEFMDYYQEFGFTTQ
ncbi:MAG: hypothetical protein K8R40_01190 [Anaerolineaceae bacterium]|nr:hypothetical protein [Anaerolineaceae bacterium]